MKKILLFIFILAALSATAQTNPFEERMNVMNKQGGIKMSDSNAELARKTSINASEERRNKVMLDHIDEVLARKYMQSRIKDMSSQKSEAISKAKQRVASGKKGIGGAPKSKVSYPSRSRGTTPESEAYNKWLAERDRIRTESALESANSNRATTQKAYENTQKAIAQANNYRPHDIQSFIPVKGNQVIGSLNDTPATQGLNVSPLAGIDKLDEPVKEEEDTEYEKRMQKYYDDFCLDENSLSQEQLNELMTYLDTL